MMFMQMLLILQTNVLIRLKPSANLVRYVAKVNKILETENKDVNKSGRGGRANGQNSQRCYQ